MDWIILSLDTTAPPPPTTTTNTTTNTTTTDTTLLRELILGANMYGLPVVIAMGVLGNTMSFVVFVASQLRHQSSSVYLAFLNFADCLFLLCLLVAHLEWFHVFLVRRDGFCQLVVYISYVSALLSVWTVVAFTVDRFIVVYYPLKRLNLCTKRRARIVVVVLLVVALLLYNFALWTNKVQPYPPSGEEKCYYSLKYMGMLYVISIADTILTMLVPSAVIIVLNVLIVVGVWRLMRKRRRRAATTVTVKLALSGSSRSDMVEAGHVGRDIMQHRSRQSALTSSARSQAVQLRTTRSLLSISTLFVILNLPSHAFRVWFMIHPTDGHTSESVHLWQLVFQFLYYLNFSCNLLMYCVCSKMFRMQFKLLLWRRGTRWICKRVGCACGCR